MRWLWIGCVACRGYHENDRPGDTALFDCLPYPLECPGCTLGETLALPDPLRHWRCEDPAEGELTAVAHRATSHAADDEHYYDPDGARIAARRVYDAPIAVCDPSTERIDEWWGEILDCAPSCEVDPSLPQADPALPPCP